MDELIFELEVLTYEVVSKLQDKSFEELDEFTEHREEIIIRIKRTEISIEQRKRFEERVKAVLKQDALIQNRMNQLKEEAGREIMKISAAQVQKNAYEGGYLSPDSMFFDRRK